MVCLNCLSNNKATIKSIIQNELDAGLFYWKGSAATWKTPGFFQYTGSHYCKFWSLNIFRRCLRGFWDVFRRENVLVNVSQNHRYYSGDLNSSSRIREQEEALFPALAGPRLSFLFLSLFPDAWEGLIRHISVWGGVTSACWGGIQIVWWIGWLTVIFILFFLTRWCCYGTLAFEVVMVLPFQLVCQDTVCDGRD